MRPSELFFLAVVAAVAAGRLLELRTAERHRRALLAAGAVESGAALYPWMVALHAAWLVASPLEVLVLHRPWRPWLAAVMVAMLALAIALRRAAMRALGGRWTTRVLVVAGEPPIASGPYRYLRHPNYTAVALETFALPLVHGAWWSALVFSALGAWILSRRVRAEERALTALDGYQKAFADRPRFLPNLR